MSTATPLRVVSLESRNEAEMARLLERHGCLPICAPSLREVPLDDQREVFAFGEKLLGGACDVLVLLTGVGTRLLVDALSTRHPQAKVIEALARTTLVCRGPKPVAALKLLGLKARAVAKEPNTWQDVLAVIDREVLVGGKRVYVQEYGKASPQLTEALRARGAEAHSVPVYAWAMPHDIGPLCRAVTSLCEGGADAVLFTSGKQIDHLLQAAEMVGSAAALRSALSERVLVASMGPMTTEALLESGVQVDLEPQHPKMGHLVTAIAKDGARLLSEKLARRS